MKATTSAVEPPSARARRMREKQSPGAADAGGARRRRIEGVAIGTLVRAGTMAEPSVDFAQNPTGGPISATSTVETCDDDVGRPVALAFEAGDPERPMILGFIHEPTEPPEGRDGRSGRGGVVRVSADGERVELRAAREIVLRCGRASITLTRAGKILVRGAYLLSRSSGVNRIKGGSVQIN